MSIQPHLTRARSQYRRVWMGTDAEIERLWQDDAA